MPKKYNQKLTPGLSKTFCEAISKGYSIEAACSEVGIVKQTYYNWMERGESAKSGKYRQFYCDVQDAENKATYRAEKPIVDRIPEDPHEAKWWLTKRRPDIYADRTYNETKLEADMKSEITVNLLDKMKEKRRELDDLNND